MAIQMQSPVVGTEQSDLLKGRSIDELFSGRQGNDTIYAADGADVAHGGRGNDLIHGDNGADTLYGGGGVTLARLDKFAIAEDYQGQIVFDGETAGYRNTLGWYKVHDGKIVDVAVLWPNASLAGSGGDLIGGVSSKPLDLAAGDQIGFFIVSDGFSQNNYGKFVGGHYEFRALDGSPATLKTVNPQLFYVNAGGAAIQVKGDPYHTAAYDKTLPLNNDGILHTVGVVDAANGVVRLGFEDLRGGGDRDFDDSMFSVNIGSANVRVLNAHGSTGYEVVDGVAVAKPAAPYAEGTENDALYGGVGNDLAFGGKGHDAIYGDVGDDRLRGDSGDDKLYGGVGNDALAGDAGADTLDGGVGNDFLVGGSGVDVLFGGVGDDLLAGGDGRDSISGGEGLDSLVGGSGDDLLYGGAAADTLDGGSGRDLLDGGASDDLLYGAAGADSLAGGDGIDRLFGGADDDVLNGGIGGDSLDGGSGRDSLDGGNGDDYLTGQAGVDILFGGDGRDELYGGSDDDILNGGAGVDTLDGGAGRDVLDGAAGDDFLTGQAGDDSLVGGAGLDKLLGGAGADWLQGGSGRDILDGGAGIDTASYADAAKGVNVYLSSGKSTGGDSDALSSIENVVGSRFGDALYGDKLANALSGGEGDDVLDGKGGADVLFGGAGADRFALSWVDAGKGVDFVADFQLRVDRIDLTDFRSHASSDELHKQVSFTEDKSGMTHIFFDADGQGGAPGIEVATVQMAAGQTGHFGMDAFLW